MKELIEKRNSIVEEINNLFKDAETEKRALTEDEQSTFEAKTAELKALDKTIEAKREARSLTMMDVETPKTPEEKEEQNRAAGSGDTAQGFPGPYRPRCREVQHGSLYLWQHVPLHPGPA